MKLVSYLEKKKSGKKNVIVFRTMNDKVQFTNDQRKKLHVYEMYDHKKGGVDIVGLLLTSIQPESNWRDGLWTHLCLHWANVEPILKQSSETTRSRLSILSLHMSLGKLLSSLAFNNDFKIQETFRQKFSTKWDVFRISTK